ncbi:hypothetical protein BJ878DRAFT_538439, partial [Calycina marina]
MAAVKSSRYYDERAEIAFAQTTTQHSTIGWDELDTRIRLNLISRVWVASRSSDTINYGRTTRTHLNSSPNLECTWSCIWDGKPLIAPAPSPQFPRGISQHHDEAVDLVDLHDTGRLARQHLHDPIASRIAPPYSKESQEDKSLFCDPSMAPAIDWKSGDGFTQAAKKKNKKANTWTDPDENAEKKDEGAGDSGDKGTGDGAGTGGAGSADGDGEKKDDKDGDANVDDDWGTFAHVKAKKKGKKGAKEEDPAPVVEKFDAFHEIKLDADPILDLSFDTTDTTSKGGGFGTWGSSWATGTTGKSTWDFSATTTTDTAIASDTKKEEEVDNNPWSLNRGKPKKKDTGSSFGALDEEEKEPDPPPDDEKKADPFDFGFVGGGTSKKDKKKKGKGAFDVEEPKVEEPAPVEEAVDDWGGGWGTNAKSKKKGGKTEPEPPPKIEQPAPAEDDWAISFGGAKKGKSKKGKVVAVEEPKVEENPAEPELAIEDDFGWGAVDKKGKKGKKGKAAVVEEIPKVEEKIPDPEPDPPLEDDGFGWGSIGKKEKKGKKGKAAIEEVKAEEPPL